jgi:outer membrane lipopolysaccharide assembly protein LptE/RlpB
MNRKFALILLLSLSILLLAGCGYNGTVRTLTGGTVAVPATSTTSSGTTTTSPSTTPNLHTSGVTVRVSASGYHVHDTIMVTISNNTSQTISFADHQSNCTIVLLQHQNAANWGQVNLCKLMTLTRFLSLKAGQSTTATLHASGTDWQTGTYRVAFSYVMGADGHQGSTGVVYSPIFQVS